MSVELLGRQPEVARVAELPGGVLLRHAAAAADEDDRNVGAVHVVHDLVALRQRLAGRRHPPRDAAEVRRCDHLLDDLVGADVDGAAGVGVVAVEPARVRRRRAEHRDPRSRLERQRPVVGQQHDRPGRGPTGQGEVLGGLDALGVVGAGVPLVEQPERHLLLEDPAARSVDDLLVQSPGPHLAGERGVVDAGRELHVDARRQRHPRRFLAVGGDVVETVEVVDRVVVGDDAAVEAQLAPEEVAS